MFSSLFKIHIRVVKCLRMKEVSVIHRITCVGCLCMKLLTDYADDTRQKDKHYGVWWDLSSNFNSERGWWEKDLEPRRREKRKKLA